MNIRLLPENLIAQIAAGEVIETPVGVVKELIENSIDAKSQNISIFIEADGYDLIQVTDDGTGMSKNDLELALKNFSSSKITQIEDLLKLNSLGFRGEALGSIRSVSRIQIETNQSFNKHGWQISAESENIKKISPSALTKGTIVRVRDLFFNVPIRKEFHSNKSSNKKSIIRQVIALSLINPKIAFFLKINNREIFKICQQEQLINRMIDLFGPEIQNNIKPIYFSESEFEIKGYISKFDHYKTNKEYIYTFVNNRWVQIKDIVSILRKVYGELMPPGQFPIAIFDIKLPAHEIDPNIHPKKNEVAFRQKSKTLNFIQKALQSVIESRSGFKVSDMQRNPSFQKLHQHRIAELLVSSEKIQNSEKNNEIGFEGNILGRLFDTYLILSSEDKLIIIDQHTAHERINFENILKKLNEQQIIIQKITPIGIILPPEISFCLEDYSENLKSIGFDWDDLGPSGIKLTAIPKYIEPGQEEKGFLLSCKLLIKQKNINPSELFINLAKDLSCQASIRKGQNVSSFQLKEVVDQLMNCQTPGRCPHGRPTMVTFDKEEVDHLFKR